MQGRVGYVVVASRWFHVGLSREELENAGELSDDTSDM